MSNPVFVKIPETTSYGRKTSYNVYLDGVLVGIVFHRRHTGVGGLGARYRHEQWGHWCWGGEAIKDGHLAWLGGVCKIDRIGAARDVVRQTLNLGYNDADKF
jgi:hypothetical protein